MINHNKLYLYFCEAVCLLGVSVLFALAIYNTLGWCVR